MPFIYLVGLMGAGKTYWGHRLSAYLQGQFVDLDEWIVQQEGQTVAEIFAKLGEAHFRLLETQALRQLPAGKLSVVATGGGTPCFENNMEFMLQNGVVVWLNPPLETLVARIWKNKQKRPLIASLAAESEVFPLLQSLLQKRLPFYQQAHLTEPHESIDLEKLTQRIQQIVQSDKKKKNDQ